MADYQDRLSALLHEELARSGMSQAELARQLGFQPQALSKWMNGKIETLSVGAIASLADYLHKDRAALAHYLESGEWIAAEPTDLERLRDRVAALEALVQQLSSRPRLAETPGRYLSPDDTLRSMTVLGLTLQHGITQAGYDWRCPSTVKLIYAHCQKAPEHGGLGTAPAIKLGRFQNFVWGLELPKGRSEISELQLAIWAFTRDESWSHQYVAALVEQGYALTSPAGATTPSATAPHPTARQ